MKSKYFTSIVPCVYELFLQTEPFFGEITGESYGFEVLLLTAAHIVRTQVFELIFRNVKIKEVP